MIERLINQERPYGEPEYSRLSEQITQLKQELTRRGGKSWSNCPIPVSAKQLSYCTMPSQMASGRR